MKDDKEHKKKLKNLTYIHNTLRSAWQWKKLVTWSDVVKHGGVLGSHKPDEPVVWDDLKSLMEQQIKELSGEPSVTAKPIEQPPVERKDTIAVDKPIAPNHSTPSVELPPPNRVVEDISNEIYNEQNNYGWVASPNQSEDYYAYWFQKKAQTELYNKVKSGKKAILLISGTGTGKTYMVGALARRLIDEKYHEGKTFCPVPYAYITKRTVVEQHSRTFKNDFNIRPNVDMDIFNIERLRSKFGSKFLKCEQKIVGGEEVDIWTWYPMISPCVVFLDESQGVKNNASTQSQCVQAYSKLPINNQIIHVSATPFTNVAEAKAFCCATQKDIEHLGFPKGTKLSESTWQSYANIIAQGDPKEHNEAAVERLMKDMDEYIVRVKGVKPQFKAINRTETIHFRNDDERQFYLSAWNRYIEEKNKYEEGYGEHPFAVMMQFSIAAEVCKAATMAERMVESVKEGYAAVCSCKWKKTIHKAVKELIEVHGVSRDNISIVWGGGETLNKKQKAKRTIIDNVDKLKEAGVDIDSLLEDLDLEKVEDSIMIDVPKEYRLGPQSMEERQSEIDRFQSGITQYCFFTFKAGGVGLSLHHSDELSKVKCRRKRSGYAVEEDIGSIPIRPRKVFVSPTYSAIEMVQGLGRCPRLTSLSDTEQIMLFYAGTIEEDIKMIVEQKLRCLSKVVRMREDWWDMVRGLKGKEDFIATTKGMADDDNIMDAENEQNNEDEND